LTRPPRFRGVGASLALFAILTGRAVSAQAAAMTLPEAVAYALNHSSTVATQRAALTQAQHQLALQRGIAYPLVDATLQSILAKSANFQGSFAVIGAQQQNVVSQNTAQVGITNWNVTTGGYSFLLVAAARAQEEQAAKTLTNTEDQIATNVTNSFYAIVERRGVVAVDAFTLKYQNILVNVASIKERAGAAAGVDVLQAKTSAAKSESTLIADRAAVEDASQSLAQQIGAPILTTFATPVHVPQPALPHGTVDTLVGVAEAARPDVGAARQAVVAANFTRRSWNVELYPQIQITAGLGNQFSPTSAVELQTELDQECHPAPPFPPPVGCPLIAPRGSFGYWSLQAVSTFSLPLIDYNARHSERVNDDAQLASTQTTLEQTILQSELDVRQSYRAAQTALGQLAWANQESAFGIESARIAQLQYKAGVKTIYDVLQSQQAAQQAAVDDITARVDYVEAVVKLRVSLGTYDARAAVADLQ
jgi:outer membrane protein, multidrug efflux system